MYGRWKCGSSAISDVPNTPWISPTDFSRLIERVGLGVVLERDGGHDGRAVLGGQVQHLVEVRDGVRPVALQEAGRAGFEIGSHQQVLPRRVVQIAVQHRVDLAHHAVVAVDDLAAPALGEVLRLARVLVPDVGWPHPEQRWCRGSGPAGSAGRPRCPRT